MPSVDGALVVNRYFPLITLLKNMKLDLSPFTHSGQFL